MIDEKSREDQAKTAASGNIGIGMIYGAGTSSLATAVYSIGIGDKSGVLLSFLEASVMVFGLAKAARAHKQLNTGRANPSTPSGPGS